MKALVTGFDPFGEHDFNPSLALVRRLRAAAAKAVPDSLAGCVFLELPTEFDTSRARLEAAVAMEKPDMVVMFGLAASTPSIRLERVALNLDDAAIPDNAGRLRQGSAIVPGGDLALMTGLDVHGLRGRLDGHGFEVVVSNHAGAYVCNHVYYAALRAMGGVGEALFVHLPAVGEAEMGRLEEFARGLLRGLRGESGGARLLRRKGSSQ